MTTNYSNSKKADRLKFKYRDELFTDKFMGGGYLIRNDYDPSQLHPPNKVIDDSEIIYRGPSPLPTLGDLGRLSRLIGLYLDRVVDDRERLADVHDFYKIDSESVEHIADNLGLPGLDIENWNVDKQRRFLRVMRYVLKRGATPKSYIHFARLLGYEARGDHLIAKRRWDSVHYNATFDTNVQAIDFDEMGSFDTGSETFPLALLRWRFYQQSTKADGTTNVGAQTLVDATATFSTTAEIGNLIVLYKQSGYVATSYHIVDRVVSDTTLHVTPTFTAGAANLIYKNCWEVPFLDEKTNFLLTRFADIAPASMKLMHLDDTL